MDGDGWVPSMKLKGFKASHFCSVQYPGRGCSVFRSVQEEMFSARGRGEVGERKKRGELEMA